MRGMVERCVEAEESKMGLVVIKALYGKLQHMGDGWAFEPSYTHMHTHIYMLTYVIHATTYICHDICVGSCILYMFVCVSLFLYIIRWHLTCSVCACVVCVYV